MCAYMTSDLGIALQYRLACFCIAPARKIAYLGCSGQIGLVGRPDGPVSMTADTWNEIKGPWMDGGDQTSSLA